MRDCIAVLHFQKFFFPRNRKSPLKLIQSAGAFKAMINSVSADVHHRRPGISQVIATAAKVSKSELKQRRGKHR